MIVHLDEEEWVQEQIRGPTTNNELIVLDGLLTF